ncbi:MAG TPA: serine/threonine protein kinase [Deltaproteobacteria bacterium]|nr:serine/threonine protein kinase [Deltaproteobacteria bacterium]
MSRVSDYEHLTPEVLLDIVEKAAGISMTGLTMPLPSYINRVYELQSKGGDRLIVKFYRPNRWSKKALEDEHEFLLDCADDEIPVVCPLRLPDGNTLGNDGGLFFALFPRKSGRALELNSDDDLKRVGSLIGRIHLAGEKRSPKDRITLHPEKSTRNDLDLLVSGGFVIDKYRESFERLTSGIVKTISPLFDDVDFIRIHGDCHRGNLLDRPGEGLMAIDFDDMMTGPPVHDLWMLLSDHAGRSRREIDLLLDGYEQFREFDYSSLRLIEPLRFMRIIYFLSWCARQVNDYAFRSNHPDWGGEIFWQREIADLKHQFQVIMEHKVAWEEGRFFGG